MDNLLNRQYFKQMFWKSSNIDIQLLDNVSAKCFSIGYHFDDENILRNVNQLTSIYPLLTVNTSCYHDNYEVSDFYVEQGCLRSAILGGSSYKDWVSSLGGLATKK